MFNFTKGFSLLQRLGDGMRFMRQLMFMIVVILSFGFSDRIVWGDEPMATLRGPVEEVLAILKDSKYNDPGAKAAQQQRLSEVTENIFDYTEMAKRSLAQNWKIFTPAQRKDFTKAFSQLLENTYTSKVQSGFKDEKVTFLSEEKLTDTVARVKTEIEGQSWDIPVDYSMFLADGKWRIYDVNIQGVSLVMNYRNQFKNILAKESPDQLIERVRNKLTD
jgi:phospholipid transport system substrate-binding protein